MKLYNGMSPNGARVMIFMAEKGIEIPTVSIDLMANEGQAADFLKINALGQVPVLQLDNGRYLTESVAICRYLESLHPSPALFGKTPEEQAFIEMWMRRMELWLFNVAGAVGLHEIEFFKYRVEQNADYAAYCRRLLVERLAWLDTEMADGRGFIAGDTFTMADIIGMGLVMVMGFVQIEVPSELTNVVRWQQAMMSRPTFPQMPG